MTRYGPRVVFDLPADEAHPEDAIEALKDQYDLESDRGNIDYHRTKVPPPVSEPLEVAVEAYIGSDALDGYKVVDVTWNDMRLKVRVKPVEEEVGEDE